MTSLVVLTGLFLLTASIVWADPPAPVARTGQTKCYDVPGNEISCAGTGQDGDLQKGVASPNPRFTDNGDGTVTDNLSGLMWAKNANFNNGNMTWNDAIDYANNLSLGNAGCGTNYTDWRLPNVRELQSLTDFGNSNPALPTGHPFTNLQSSRSSRYWSSTSYAYDSVGAWTMGMYDGLVGPGGKVGTYYVWPVRGETTGSPAPVAKTGQTTSYRTGDDGDLQKGVTWPDPRFTDNGDGTVTDNLTGLMWAKNSNLNNRTEKWDWAIGLSNILSLGNAGCGTSYTDWRLPNVRELQSLTDFGNSIPGLPTGHPFTNLYARYHWSSTTHSYNTNDAKTVSTEGGVSYVTKNATNYVWPVRGGN